VIFKVEVFAGQHLSKRGKKGLRTEENPRDGNWGRVHILGFAHVRLGWPVRYNELSEKFDVRMK